MSMKKSYAVFGLGRYGLAVAKELVNSGVDVLAIDENSSVVNSAIADIPVCRCADVTDAEAIEQLGISNIDVVIISMAHNLEASVMAIMHCKAAGVKTIIAKCANETHGEIMSKVGADKVVFPEIESGTRLAKNLISSGFVDIIDLSKDVSMLEIECKPDWIGKTLIELDLRRKYGINVIAIRDDDKFQTNVDPSITLGEHTKLVIIANTTKIGKILK